MTYKYPSIEDVFSDGLSIALAFPFVDMIIAITNWNEQPPYAWEDNTDKYEDEKDDDTYPDFTENIEVGIWIHDNKIELLASIRARAKYEEYVALYGLKDTSKYTHDYYGESKEQLYDQVELSKKCFKLNGFDPETIFNKKSNVTIYRG